MLNDSAWSVCVWEWGLYDETWKDLILGMGVNKMKLGVGCVWVLDWPTLEFSCLVHSKFNISGMFCLCSMLLDLFWGLLCLFFFKGWKVEKASGVLF